MEATRSHARYCGGACRAGASRLRRGESAQKRTGRASGPSGLQVSYRKAEAAAVRAAVLAYASGLAVASGAPKAHSPTERASRLMAEALSPAQRARLEARS